MDAETIERLLIDKEMGELSRDAGRLLDAYLAANPASEDIARNVEATITLARRALPPARKGAMPTMPPLSRRMVSPPVRPRARPAGWHRHLAVAAAIVLAFVLGNRHSPQTESPTVMPSPVVRLQADKPDPGGFWSFSSLREALPRHPRRDIQQIEWTTPLGQPRIGERT